MKATTLGIGLFAATLAAISFFPLTQAGTKKQPSVKHNPPTTNTPSKEAISSAPAIDVMFVVDTTGSMGGFIETAKEKIWSIATTMTSAQQSPNIRIGLVAYRDRGDAYVTQTTNLSEDIDSVYASLMDFEAAGGGDGPESVNKGLYEAINNVSWSQNPNAYKTVFLVGDAPPHMNYKNDVRYIQSVMKAARSGIIVNTIQCGHDRKTAKIWQQIAEIGGGKYFQVEQAGGALAINSPYDEALARLSEKLDDTRLYFGSESDKAKMEEKVEATKKLHAESSISSRARRSVFNASDAGKRNSLGEQELVEAVTSGELAVEDIKTEQLPASMQKLNAQARSAKIEEMAETRKDLQKQIRQLSEQRKNYIQDEIAKAGPTTDSLDDKLYEAVRDQGAKAGLTYDSGPEY